jgi:hypothetical protein
MAKTLAFALLIFAQIWNSVLWRSRTRLKSPPWNVGSCFTDGGPAMTNSVAEAIGAWGDHIREIQGDTKQLVEYHSKKHARDEWKHWVAVQSRHWGLNAVIDGLLQSRNWDLSYLVRESGKAEVCVTYFR